MRPALRSAPLLAALLGAALAAPAGAQAPRSQVHASESGAWRARVRWGGAGEDGSAQPAHVSLSGPDGAQAEYDLGPFPTAPTDVLLADDGALYAFDDRQRYGDGVVVGAWSPAGEARWQRTLEELLPAELLDRLPRGGTMRNWRMRPLDARSTALEDGLPALSIGLWNADRVLLAVADGAATYVRVEDHGDDAKAWLASARDLMLQGRFDEALPGLSRVVELDPSELTGWSELARCLEALQRTDDALLALQRGTVANPISTRADRQSPVQTRRNLWLHRRLVRAFADAGQVDQARRTGAACLAVDPAQWDVIEVLAGLEWDAGDPDAARKLVAEAWPRFLARSSGGPGDRALTQMACQVGNFFVRRSGWADARIYLEQGLEGGAPNDSLYRMLARVLEELRDYEAAIGVCALHMEDLMRRSAEVDDPNRRQSIEGQILALEQQVARLDELSRAQAAEAGAERDPAAPPGAGDDDGDR